jgi:hypothetical protein
MRRNCARGEPVLFFGAASFLGRRTPVFRGAGRLSQADLNCQFLHLAGAPFRGLCGAIQQNLDLNSACEATAQVGIDFRFTRRKFYASNQRLMFSAEPLRPRQIAAANVLLPCKS